jgi:hypothetical protein
VGSESVVKDVSHDSSEATTENKTKNGGTLRHNGKALGTYSISEDGKKLEIWLYPRDDPSRAGWDDKA